MTHLDAEGDDRREFLKSCGKFAAVTPPTVTLLLSTSLTSATTAGSGGRIVHSNNVSAIVAVTPALTGKRIATANSAVQRAAVEYIGRRSGAAVSRPGGALVRTSDR